MFCFLEALDENLKPSTENLIQFINDFQEKVFDFLLKIVSVTVRGKKLFYGTNKSVLPVL